MSALALVFALMASPVFAQGGSSSATLSGVVVDKDGGLIPGATVVVTNAATGEKLPTVVTNDKGAYSFPGLSIGTYKVTVTLSGFKTSETEVRLVGGSTNNITSTLEIGKVEEVVNVRAGSELVRTETPAVSQTVTADFMNTLPRNSRSALAFLAFLPGVQTTGSANNLRFGSNVTGLGSNTVNITLDGVVNGLKKRSDPSDQCTADGCWDYTTDNKVELLGKACDSLDSATTSKVDIYVGCETVLK
jgi:hypothetical protein